MADGAGGLRQRVTYVLPLPREIGGWRNTLGPQTHPPPPPTKTFAVPPRCSHRDHNRLRRRGPLLVPVSDSSDASAAESDSDQDTDTADAPPAEAPPFPVSDSQPRTRARTRTRIGTRPSHARTPRPRHMLPVTSLALDLTTCLGPASDEDVDPQLDPDARLDDTQGVLSPALGGGNASHRTFNPPRPRGLLYTAGRDALIASWELSLPTHWSPASDPASGQPASRPWRLTQPYWQIHPPASEAATKGRLSDSHFSLKRPVFRQGIQAHSEWVNDMLLINGNQTVVSASSDRLIKAWNPHDEVSNSSSFTLGSHDDYVKCLAAPAWQLDAGQTQTIFSGGLDRTVKMWDLNATPTRRACSGNYGLGFGADDMSACQPVLTLTENEDELPSSVYRLSVDGRGSLIGVGCSSNEVSVYDVRSRVRVAKLVGHTGYVRDLLLSADGRHLLSASSDSTVRLWSIAEQRALHTFEHHSDSVWALYSQDLLERDTLNSFYSADRVGDLCKVDWSDAPDIVSGECILLARNRPSKFNHRGSQVPIPFDSSAEKVRPHHGPSHQGIHRIVAADDAFVFTASDTSSSVLAWPDVPKRKDRLARYASITAHDLSGTKDSQDTWASQARAAMQSNHSTTPDISIAVEIAGVPASSLVTLGDDQSLFDDRTGEDGKSTLESGSRAGGGREAPPSRMALLREVADVAISLFQQPCARVSGGVGLIRSSLLNDRRHVLTMDTRGSVGIWDILVGFCLGFFERRALTRLALEEGAMAGTGTGFSSGSGLSQEAITNLLTHSPADLLELLRDRIEGSDAAPFWCTTDVRAGLLSVHLQSNKCFDAEMYLDDAEFVDKTNYKEDTRVNMGRWVLQNLFRGFIEKEVRARNGARVSGSYGGAQLMPPTVTQKDVLAAEEPTAFSRRGEEPKPLAAPLGASLAILPQDKRPVLPPRTDSGQPGQWSPYRPTLQLGVEVQMKALQEARAAQSQSASLHPKTDERTTNGSGAEGSSSNGGGFMSRFKRKPKDKENKDKKHPPGQAALHQRPGLSHEPDHLRQIREIVSWVSLLSPPLPAGYGVTDIPPSQAHPLLDLPPLPFPSGVMVLFGAMSPQAGQALPAYRETLDRMAEDVPLLELVASPWLLSHLLTAPPSIDAASGGAASASSTAAGIHDSAAYEAAVQGTLAVHRREPQKVSFTLTAWMPAGSDEHTDTFAARNDWVLPDLPASTTRLTATQMLRMKKVAGYVVDKLLARRQESLNLDQKNPQNAVQAPFWSTFQVPAEDQVEIVCNDTLVPANMTLAQARRYLFKQSGDLKLEYRRAKPGLAPAQTAPTTQAVPSTSAFAPTIADVPSHSRHAFPSGHAPSHNVAPGQQGPTSDAQSSYVSRPSMADSYAPASDSDREATETDTDTEAELEFYRNAKASVPLHRLGYQ